MNKNKITFVCDICGRTITGLDEYVTHVTECSKIVKAKLKAEQDKKYLEEVNAAINKVKAAKDYYDTCLKEFKEKYPKEYEMNFGKTTEKLSKTKPNILGYSQTLSEDEFFHLIDELLGCK